jgi:hypothetical protein
MNKVSLMGVFLLGETGLGVKKHTCYGARGPGAAIDRQWNVREILLIGLEPRPDE